MNLKKSFTESELINQVQNNNRAAQKQLFDQFSPTMLSTCRQYIKDLHNAEDVMLCAFMKVFQNINQYRNDGSFEGWIRKIMIRESLSFLRSKKELDFIEDANQSVLSVVSESYEISNDYQKLIDDLPKGCRYIFVLNVIEGYKHQEIAEMLNISVGTSKSQLAYAKKLLKQQIELIR
ncbi:RNA polymerase sigma factor [Paenimyroides baculatum]|uniref:RNA polymerase sigma factor n=1 Tax=Paenimyroides baculatum TaxID=2608000 RepID=A0A5M6CA24_9FLAO|nr:RNA polymerase sigma factor [Paenimyroides baculatum]KAA5531893.1 RNA polymerase sigma factor [Paenimyroides baculatum]